PELGFLSELLCCPILDMWRCDRSYREIEAAEFSKIFFLIVYKACFSSDHHTLVSGPEGSAPSLACAQFCAYHHTPPSATECQRSGGNPAGRVFRSTRSQLVTIGASC